MRGCIEGGEREIMDGSFTLLLEVAVEGEDVANVDECRVDECETAVRERHESETKRRVFKREFDGRGDRLYAETKNDGDRFGREEILEGGKMGVRICAKVFVCGDEFRAEVVSPVTGETPVDG